MFKATYMFICTVSFVLIKNLGSVENTFGVKIDIG